MISWSLKKRITYLSFVLGFIAILLGWFLFVGFYEPASCFDGKQNGIEAGVDCGGDCQYLCENQVADPVVLFSRAFEITGGVYSAVAYVENPNFDIGNASIPYTFKFYDRNNDLILERSGRTFIPAGRVSPIFEGTIDMDGEVPTRTVFELEDNGKWERVGGYSGSPFLVRNQNLTNVSSRPRVTAEIVNTTVNTYEDVEVVTVVFNALENAIATSRTFIDDIGRKEAVDIFFTWPEPFESELEACVVPVDVALLLDVSGSMNNDNDDPPQPLTDAKDAAASFIERLNPTDRAGLVTFATRSRILERFTARHDQVLSSLEQIAILPEEETGATNMGDAIQNAIFLLQNDASDREDTERVIILLTDGIANEPEDPGGEPYALDFANRAKDRGYTIYTIGIGEEVNETFLQAVASPRIDPEDQFYFNAASSQDLQDIYAELSDAICERGPAIIDIIPRLPD